MLLAAGPQPMSPQPPPAARTTADGRLLGGTPRGSARGLRIGPPRPANITSLTAAKGSQRAKHRAARSVVLSAVRQGHARLGSVQLGPSAVTGRAMAARPPGLGAPDRAIALEARSILRNVGNRPWSQTPPNDTPPPPPPSPPPPLEVVATRAPQSAPQPRTMGTLVSAFLETLEHRLVQPSSKPVRGALFGVVESCCSDPTQARAEDVPFPLKLGQAIEELHRVAEEIRESEPAAATEVAADARLLQSFSRQMLRDDRDLAVLQQCISDALEERHALLRHRHCLLSSGPAADSLAEHCSLIELAGGYVRQGRLGGLLGVVDTLSQGPWEVGPAIESRSSTSDDIGAYIDETVSRWCSLHALMLQNDPTLFARPEEVQVRQAELSLELPSSPADAEAEAAGPHAAAAAPPMGRAEVGPHRQIHSGRRPAKPTMQSETQSQQSMEELEQLVGGVWQNAYTGRDKRRGLTIGEEGVGESSGPRSGRAAVGGPKKPPAPLGGRGIKRFYGQPEVSQAAVAAEEKAAAGGKRKLKASQLEVPQWWLGLRATVETATQRQSELPHKRSYPIFLSFFSFISFIFFVYLQFSRGDGAWSLRAARVGDRPRSSD